jgi:hypothetical protein
MEMYLPHMFHWQMTDEEDEPWWVGLFKDVVRPELCLIEVTTHTWF